MLPQRAVWFTIAIIWLSPGQVNAQEPEVVSPNAKVQNTESFTQAQLSPSEETATNHSPPKAR